MQRCGYVHNCWIIFRILPLLFYWNSPISQFLDILLRISGKGVLQTLHVKAFFFIIYKLKQRSLQVSGDGNNHIVPRTMPHKKCKKIDYKVIYLLHDTQCYQSVTVTSFMEIQRAVQYAWRRNHHKSDTPSSLNNKMWHKAECVFLYFRKYLEQLLHFLCYGAVRLKFSRRLFPLPTS